ncbi:esterase-like activity of phytase family protein [Aureimonas leprariae]|uniref:Esterase-like activity of phytase family protein n=1 Tax=Plantimonas leprariae TaxID=2615207 RepID=A0A7V7PQ23_9HYPH|nr:esterase-like activity of phytase family protein [Aureimonas leprariae]KAB0680199.1 esterase-like activity of phytase family protein [Aureimonas leprariae]
MILVRSLAILLVGASAAFAADNEGTRFDAVLAGQAVLPADTLVAAPADAPEFLRQAGKFTTPDRKRTSELGKVPGMDGKRPTGFGLPLDGQAVQGFSGIRRMPDGTFWSLSDNGFGSKATSSDGMLMLHHLAFDWQAGKVDRRETVFLSDPDKVAPFPIVMEGSDKRYLTGADFDVESIQPVADGFWIGDEFGPWLMKFDRDGHLKEVHDTRVGEVKVLSPDNPTLQLPADPTKPLPAFDLKRSGGFEGLAQSPDGAKLYALLEGPLFKDGAPEKTADGWTALRIVEFDVAKDDWTGRSWLYPFAPGGESIGDFNMLDDRTALVIERDNGVGRASAACSAEPKPDCFDKPAKLKRVTKIAFDDANVGKAVDKLGFIDLLAIKDPKGVAKQGGHDGLYDMPFVTIENVDRVDATHIVVGNDNNFPFSAGRAPNRADDDEFVLLEVAELLDAR